MCQEGWCVGLVQEGVVLGWGECLKYFNTLKGGGIEKMGGETKILKRGSKPGQGVGVLKTGERGAGTPLRTLFLYIFDVLWGIVTI